MRVGLDYRPALVNREGIGRYARELVRGMVELGFDGSLGLFGYTLGRRRFTRAELGIADTRAELLRLRLPSRTLPWLLRRMGKGVDDLVGGCEVYHHTQPSTLTVRSAREVVTVFDCIAVLDAEGDGGPGFLDPEVAARTVAGMKATVERAARVLVPSQFVGAEVVMALGAHPGRVTVTTLGCDHVLAHLPPGGVPRADPPYVLTVARVDRRKNHVRILDAFERLVREGLPHRWLVVGPRGFGAEDFEAALARSPAADRVEWRTDVPDAELPGLYAAADVLVWPSLNEGFGLPPLEAMACGTPVVASAVTSMPEILGDAAFYVEPTDPERIFEATRRLIAEPDLRDEHVARGKRQAREHTWRGCAKDTLLAYRAAADEEPGSEPRMGGLF